MSLTWTTQLDHKLVNTGFVTIPVGAPGRTEAGDFVHFKWDTNFPYQNYAVVIETLSPILTPGGNRSYFRSIGPLAGAAASATSSKVQLPAIVLSNKAKIVLVPNIEGYPVYIGVIGRGNLYTLPSPYINGVMTKNVTYQMTQQ